MKYFFFTLLYKKFIGTVSKIIFINYMIRIIKFFLFFATSKFFRFYSKFIIRNLKESYKPIFIRIENFFKILSATFHSLI